MKTLHICGGVLASTKLRQAVKEAGRDDEVLSFPDALNCGPIDSDEPLARAEWWSRLRGGADIDAELSEFWQRVTDTLDRLVVWFGRHDGSELAFFLAWADRLGVRPYEIINVTGRQFPFTGRDGAPRLSHPTQAVFLLAPDDLRSLLGAERPITAEERDESIQRWRRLRDENASFRVVTERGLISAPVDVFDPLILDQATPEWQSEVRLIVRTMGNNMEPYIQVGDVTLMTRVVALVEAGKLLADGDPWDMRACRIRLPV